MDIKISPEKFLEYAKQNFKQLNNHNEERILINTYGCIAKGFHSQIDELVTYIKIFKKPKTKLEHFPEKFDFIKDSKLFAPEQVLFLNERRNDLEHRYTVPSKDIVKLSIGYLEYFIRDSKEFMQIPAKVVKDLIDKKLKLLEKKRRESKPKETTVEAYLLQAKKFFYFLGKDPDLITSHDADKYIKKMMDANYPAGQIQQIEAIIRFTFEKVLCKNWEQKVKRPPIKKKDLPFIDEEKLKEIIKQAPSLRDKLIIKTIYYSGLKSGDVPNLKIEQINKLNFPEEELREMKEYLKNRQEGHIFLANTKKPLGQRGIQNLFEFLSKKLKRKITTEMIRKSNPNIRFNLETRNKEITRKPRKILRKDDILTEEELKKMQNQVQDNRRKDYLFFAYNLGVGLNQFKSIKFEDINFQKNYINYKPAKHHQFSRRNYPEDIIEKLKEYCKKYKITKGLVFPQKKEAMRYLVESSGEKAGIDKNKIAYGILANSKYFKKIWGNR